LVSGRRKKPEGKNAADPEGQACNISEGHRNATD
jgi:hypothetical protein